MRRSVIADTITEIISKPILVFSKLEGVIVINTDIGVSHRVVKVPKVDGDYFEE
jgi:restriction endonuclease Mrr